MPQERGRLTAESEQRIAKAMHALEVARREQELAIAAALKAGGSIREVAAFTGMSTRTIQEIGHRNGWPTAEQRRREEAKREAREEWRRYLNRPPDETP